MKIVLGFMGVGLGLVGVILLITSCFLLTNNYELAVKLHLSGWVGVVLMWVFVAPFMLSYYMEAK